MMTCGGYITADLEDAREAHMSMGGYLLIIGDRPREYVVCQELEAIHAWGRTAEGLRAIGPDFSEA